MSILLIALEVLKWIGILLLFLLGILLVFLLLVLFSPIRYEAEGEKKQDMKGWVKIDWIFRIIRFSLSFTASEGIRYSAKVLTFSLLDSEMEPKPKKEKRRKKQLEPVKKPEPEKTEQTTPIEQKISSEKTEKESKKIEKRKVSMEMQKERKMADQEKKSSESQQKEEKPPVIRKIKMTQQIQEEKPKEENFSDSSEEEQKKEKLNKDYFLKMSMEEKKKLFTITKRLVCRIGKSVFPKKIRADLEFGTGDPALTGEILGAASVAQIMMNEECRIKANFHHAMIEGELWIRGRVFLASLGFEVIRFILEKPIRKIIVLYWKG